MGYYYSVDGWMSGMFNADEDARDELARLFELGWGFPLVTEDSEQELAEESPSSSRYAAWQFSDSWAIVGCLNPRLAVGCEVKSQYLDDFLDLVRNLASVINDAYLANPGYQIDEDNPYPLSLGGTIWVDAEGDDHQCWVIREGIVHVYDKDTPLVKNWINAVRGPRNSASP